MPEVVPQLETIVVSPLQNLAAMHRGLRDLDRQIAEAEESPSDDAKDALLEAISVISAYDIENGAKGEHQSTIAELKRLAWMDIKALREQRAQRSVEYEEELSRIAPSLEYGEDKFLKALKKKGESFREGKIKIMRTSRTVRNVLTEKFAKTFPDLLPKVCKIELTKADALIGKKTMEQFCEQSTSYRYELVDMEIEELEKI